MPTVSDNSPATEAHLLSVGDGEQHRSTARRPRPRLRFNRSGGRHDHELGHARGAAQVSALSASGNSKESIPVTAPTTAGEYYYGACVDAVTNESDTNDNCSVSVSVDVSEPSQQTAPNLSVSSPSVDNSSTTTGAPFSLSATGEHTGDGEAACNDLAVLPVGGRHDHELGHARGQRPGERTLGIGQQQESIPVTAPTTAGEYYYGACVDAVTNESDTNDNCSVSVRVDVSEPSQLLPHRTCR